MIFLNSICYLQLFNTVYGSFENMPSKVKIKDSKLKSRLMLWIEIGSLKLGHLLNPGVLLLNLVKAASCFYLSCFSCVKPIKTFWKPIRRSLAKIWTNYLLITFCRLRDKQFFLTYPAVYSQAVEIRWYYHPLEWTINNPCKRYCFWGENLYPLLRRYDTFKTVIE